MTELLRDLGYDDPQNQETCPKGSPEICAKRNYSCIDNCDEAKALRQDDEDIKEACNG